MGMNMKMNFIRQRDNMKLKTNLMVSSLMLLIAALTTSCSSTTTSDSNNNLSTRLVIEKAAPIPVLDGQATSTGIYVRNTSSKAITDITYAVVNTNDNNQNLAVNASACRNIAAHSSCLLPIMTPSLELGNSGANLIVASYDGQQSKQLINYRYTRLADYSGVNFSDNSQSLYGTNDYATSYVFVGNGQSQANVGFNTSNNSLAIIGGLTNGKVDIPAKSVIALELQSNQNVTSNLVMVTPYTVTTSKGLTAALQLGAQNNSQLQVTITPQQQANLLMSNVGILSASESTATLTLMNNGNKEATTINLNSSSTVDVAIEAAQTNPCGATLAVGASCNYKLKLLNQESNGNVVLTLSYNNARANVQALQSVYYFNNRGAPMVIVAPNQSIFTEGVGTNQNIIFKVENIGGSKLSNMVITPLKNGLTNTTLTVPNNTCGSTLAAESCQFSVNVAASGLIDSGVIYANVKGSAGTTSYSFMSKSVAATITDSAAPSVTSTTPQNTQIGVLASTAIVVNFSEAMKAITLNTTNIMLQKVSDSSVIPLTLQGVTNNNQTVTFTQTSGKLVGFTDYKIVINPSQIQDVNGNALDAGQTESTIATFTTGDTIAPSIVTVNPTNGATNQSRTPTMNITFSESMDQTTLSTSNILLKDGNGTLVSGYTTSYNSATNTVTINLNSNLLSETTYRIILNEAAITDIAGNALGSDGNYVATQFTTGDFIAPTLSSTTPVNGATNVAVESGISLTFSESMDTSTLTDTTIKLQKASDNSDVSLESPPSYSNGNRTVSLTPTANLANGESYNIVINPSLIKDVSGNPMGVATESVVANFMTKRVPSITITPVTNWQTVMGSAYAIIATLESGSGGISVVTPTVSGLSGAIVTPASCELVDSAESASCTFIITPYTGAGNYSFWDPTNIANSSDPANPSNAYSQPDAISLIISATNNAQINGGSSPQTFSNITGNVIAPYIYLPAPSPGLATESNTGITWGTNGAVSTRFEAGKDSGGSLCISSESVVVDNLTGLMWVKNPTNTTYNWADAQTYVAGLTYCGYSDWRLPTINELTSLINYAVTFQNTWLNANGFSNVKDQPYMTSTLYDNNNFRVVDFWRGYTNYYRVNDPYYILPVRGN